MHDGAEWTSERKLLIQFMMMSTRKGKHRSQNGKKRFAQLHPKTRIPQL